MLLKALIESYRLTLRAPSVTFTKLLTGIVCTEYMVLHVVSIIFEDILAHRTLDHGGILSSYMRIRKQIKFCCQLQ